MTYRSARGARPARGGRSSPVPPPLATPGPIGAAAPRARSSGSTGSHRSSWSASTASAGTSSIAPKRPHLDRLATSGVRARRTDPVVSEQDVSRITTPWSPASTPGTTVWSRTTCGIRSFSAPRTRSAAATRSRTAAGTAASRSGSAPSDCGLRTSPYFWPGSEAEIGGVRPNVSVDRYDGDYRRTALRIDIVLDRLTLEPSRRALIRDALLQPDRRCRRTATIRTSRTGGGCRDPGGGRPGRLSARRPRAARPRGIRTGSGLDLILVSDHGMAANSLERAILLDSYVDIETANLVDWTPVLAALWPKPENGRAASTEALHGAHPHLSVYRRDEIPERYHYRDCIGAYPSHPGGRGRGLGDHHVAVASRPTPATLLRVAATATTTSWSRWAPCSWPAGPSFRSGLLVEPFQNIHVYELMCHLLRIPPAPNDGELATVRHLLRECAVESPS